MVEKLIQDASKAPPEPTFIGSLGFILVRNPAHRPCTQRGTQEDLVHKENKPEIVHREVNTMNKRGMEFIGKNKTVIVHRGEYHEQRRNVVHREK